MVEWYLHVATLWPTTTEIVMTKRCNQFNSGLFINSLMRMFAGESPIINWYRILVCFYCLLRFQICASFVSILFVRSSHI